MLEIVEFGAQLCKIGGMSVSDNFKAFRANYLIPADTVHSISYRYKRITKQLNKDYWSTESETAHSLYVGSYGRDTAAKGVSDLDVAFTLPNSIYHKYDAYQSNGQSALLQAVRTSIQKTYSITSIGGDGQVVVVAFDDGIIFEILPVFLNRDGTTFTFPDSNGGGSWKTCDPRGEMAAFAARDTVTANGNLKAIGRMARIWRDRHSVPISGMLIDTLAFQFGRAWLRQTSKVTVKIARGLRRALSPPEVLLWQRLRLRPCGVKFRRQHPVGRYVADFYAPDARLIVEVDGVAHDRGDRPERDALRDDWLREQGFVVVRIAASDVLKDVDAVVDGVVRLILASR